MEKLLIESIEKYLDLFDSKDDFITENAFKAMLHHYLEVKMVDFYLKVNPNDMFILRYDNLGISVTTKSYNYLRIEFQRAFRFDNEEDAIQIRLELHFENISDNSRYDEYFELSTSDSDNIFEDRINSLMEDLFYKQVTKMKPTHYGLLVHYDF
ncbi:hypothetical protein LPB90_16840 [Chryseobacterium sp. LC2016-29]|uniref:hypothetical protein n=1 Tax=Chryseobacterium sp. LC2016-29 TaxID=2897331 RepID=UPI001E38AD5A|nr:hypothetical protein [Chryseobacterium sp. LC2016-29]MCD0480108.1 hypothetical protein [Chryseobacterium sp. LC2016-29]